MSVLITSDLHFSDNPRDQYRFDFAVGGLLDTLIAKQPDRLLILGDITEKKDNHSAVLVNTVTHVLKKLSNMCPVYILRGNHDGLDANWPFFEFLDELTDNRIVFIKTPQNFLFDDLGSCMFLPHTTNYKKDWAGIDFEEYNFIFAHNTFKGTKSESGRELDGIPTNIFPEGKTVYSGDIHMPQRVGGIKYVGSPYTVDFGDDFEPRMLYIYEHSRKRNLRIKDIPCKGAQKRLVEATVRDKKDVVLDRAGLNSYDILKVRVSLTAEQYAYWSEIRAAVRAWGDEHCFVIHMVQPVTEKGAKSKKVELTTTARSDHEILSDYGSDRKVDDRTMKVGYRIVDKGA